MGLSEGMVGHIKDAFQKHRVLYTQHARDEMREEALGTVSDSEVAEAIANCEAIEEYPDDTPYPSVLVLGYTEVDRPLHVVVAYSESDQTTVVVTVYQPDPDRWIDYRRRKT